MNRTVQTLEKQDLYEKCRTKSHRELEEECISHMYNHKFHKPPPLPLDLSGKTIKFSGRDGDSRKLEWYKASLRDNGALSVTYNSQHVPLKSDKHHVFYSGANQLQDEKALEAQRARVAAMQQKRQKEQVVEERKRKEKAKRDRERFNKASENGQSVYLSRKRVGAHGLRFEKVGDETVILVPMRDQNGEIQALQEIYETKRTFGNETKPRDKNFTNSVKGLFHVIGKIVDRHPIRISEGYATAASCYESTECFSPHVVAFSAGAYKTIIPILRKLYPNSPISICADNNLRDNPEEENTGVKEAEKAAKETPGCSVTYPIFPKGKERNKEGNRYADFNDLMIVEGKDMVRMQLENTAHSNNTEEGGVFSLMIAREEDIAETTNKHELIFEYVSKSLIRNERGDAELFLKFKNGNYIFDPSEGKDGQFYFWNGTFWQIDRKKQRYKDIEVVSKVYEQAAIQAGKNEETVNLSKELSKRAYSVRSMKRCKSIFEFVSSEVPLEGEWDYCQGQLPCLNGIVDLKTGKISPHKPEFLLRSVCPTSYNTDAPRPLFEKFLNDITLGDNEIKTFLGRVLGYALLGIPKEERVFIFYGKNGRNGKGTLLQTLEKVLGPLAKTFPSEMLLLQRNPPSSSTPRPEKANLQGTRFAIFSEIDEHRKLDASEVKNLSGRDTINCRRLYSNVDIQIRPSHTIVI